MLTFILTWFSGNLFPSIYIFKGNFGFAGFPVGLELRFVSVQVGHVDKSVFGIMSSSDA